MKGRNYFSRDDYVKYQLPKGAIKVCDKASDAVAYIYAQHDAPCAVVFYGTPSEAGRAVQVPKRGRARAQG